MANFRTRPLERQGRGAGWNVSRRRSYRPDGARSVNLPVLRMRGRAGPRADPSLASVMDRLYWLRASHVKAWEPLVAPWALLSSWTETVKRYTSVSFWAHAVWLPGKAAMPLA